MNGIFFAISKRPVGIPDNHSGQAQVEEASILDICGPHRPDAGGSIEFVNAAALVHRHVGKIPKCCRIIDER